MKDQLEKLIKEKSPGLDEEDIRLGFHWPPFNSIAHLHMHGIAPVHKMGFFQNIIFKPSNKWFCTVSTLTRIDLDLRNLFAGFPTISDGFRDELGPD